MNQMNKTARFVLSVTLGVLLLVLFGQMAQGVASSFGHEISLQEGMSLVAFLLVVTHISDMIDLLFDVAGRIIAGVEHYRKTGSKPQEIAS